MIRRAWEWVKNFTQTIVRDKDLRGYPNSTWDCKLEKYTHFFNCPHCGGPWVEIYVNYCYSCGDPLVWDIAEGDYE